MLLTLIAMFFTGSVHGRFGPVLTALFLLCAILCSIFMTFGVTKLLTATVLHGMESSFVLELPPYRMPQIGSILVRSVLDRTLFVLGRAVTAAIPAGILIWGMGNIDVAGQSLLHYTAAFLDPFAKLLGLDGMILLGFLLGFPANEIVLPVILMGYLSQGTLMGTGDVQMMRAVLIQNGWTWMTAVNVVLFTLFHWPCATTVLTIRKETGSIKWMLVGIFLPTAVGIICCLLFNGFVRLL